MATKFHPTPIVMSLIDFIAPSRPIAIFCQYKEVSVINRQVYLSDLISFKPFEKGIQRKPSFCIETRNISSFLF